MRPFEAHRRVYLIYEADTMNEDAADALLKDLEEPPPYAVIVLVASDLGPIPETIRSRCQHVPFRRLSERAVREEIEARAPALEPEQVTALARVAGGRLDRVDRLLDPAAARRRDALLTLARSVYRDPAFEPGEAAADILAAAAERGDRCPRGRRRRARAARLDRSARPISGFAAHSGAPSARSSSPRSRSSPPGIATSWSSRRAPSALRSTPTGSRS